MRVKTTSDKELFLSQPANIRRQMIAKDIINSINARKIAPKTGSFLAIGTVDYVLNDDGPAMYGNWGQVSKYEPSEHDTCMALLDEDKVCVCCARGAMLASRIGYQHPVDSDCKDDLIFSEGSTINSRLTSTAALIDEFSKHQLELIENAFECSNRIDDEGTRTSDLNAAEAFGLSYDGEAERLIAIMEIIANDPDGMFKIPEKYYENEGDDDETEDNG